MKMKLIVITMLIAAAFLTGYYAIEEINTMKAHRYGRAEPVDVSSLKPGQTEVFGGIEFCFIPGGTYMMGSPESEKDRGYEEQIHRVRVSPFWLAKYEVTQKEYMDIMGVNPSHFAGTGLDLSRLPVENVSWYNVVEFCNRLSIKHGIKPYYKIDKSRKDPNNKNSYDKTKWTVTIAGGNGFRLPTEAEWEYACRAGTTTAFHYGNRLDSSMANFNGNKPYSVSNRLYLEKTTAVGSFRPNAWGLYDMHGNVFEWCFDWYDESYYTKSPVSDPPGSDCGKHRVFRGGCWYFYGFMLRSANRDWFRADYCSFINGFRVARSVK